MASQAKISIEVLPVQFYLSPAALKALKRLQKKYWRNENIATTAEAVLMHAIMVPEAVEGSVNSMLAYLTAEDIWDRSFHMPLIEERINTALRRWK